MKTKSILQRLLLAGLVLVTLTLQLSALLAQTTAFTYQGRLLVDGLPANGLYDFRFALFDDGSIRDPYTGYQTNAAVQVTDGLFTTALDFEAAAFNRPEAWLGLAVRTNSKVAAFVNQWPRQQITSAPWAVRAGDANQADMAAGVAPGSITAAALTPGTVTEAALATGAVTSSKLASQAVTAGALASGAVTTPKLADGAVIAAKLGSEVVTSDKIADGTIVNADVSGTAAIVDTKLANITTAGKVANSATTATAANTANAIVARDASGNFTAGAITAGTFSGGGSALTGLNAGQLTTGTVPDARLGANVALRAGGNTFSGNQLVSSGNVGIGTTTPESLLDVRGLATLQATGANNHDNLRIKKTGSPSSTNAEFVLSHRSEGTGLWLYGFNGTTYRNLQGWDYANQIIAFPADGQDLVINESLGRVGVGTASPQQRFHVMGTSRLNGIGSGLGNPALLVTNNSSAGVAIYSVTASSDANMVVVNKAGGELIKGFSGAGGGNLVFQVSNAGRVYCGDELDCKTLMIRGGADLAEPFPLSGADVPPGAVMVIDPDQPGRLKVSTEAYDSKVAGIVSGAGGVQPGIVLTQTEVLEDGRNVALSGRVFALVDADHAPVQPGDLLTTSTTPGHAMKATDVTLRSGAILGKAMSPLAEGRGLVLVLVSLQ